MNQVSSNQIFTIGHGTRKSEEFIDLLKQYNIDILIDVRSFPYSRFHPQYRKSNLEDTLRKVGINYLWLGKELGGRPSDPSLYNDGKANYQAIKETKLFQDGLQQLLKLTSESIKVTLMCSESDQNDCHREHLIAAELTKFGISILHINKKGLIVPHMKMNDYNLFN